METPGELYDKISILEIRLEKHPDPKACVDINDKLNLLRQELRNWDGPKRLLSPTHKLRGTPMRDFSDLAPKALVISLASINAQAWENEDARDRLMPLCVPQDHLDDAHFEPLYGLHQADQREQRLNQDRTALIDAINAKWLKGERP